MERPPPHFPRHRGFSIVEILVVLGIVVVLMGFFLAARPMRAARRIELLGGHKQIADGRFAGARLWEFTLSHCRKLFDFCKGDPLYQNMHNQDGTVGDHDVDRLGELLDLYDAALAANPPQSTAEYEWRIESLRRTLEARYLKLGN